MACLALRRITLFVLAAAALCRASAFASETNDDLLKNPRSIERPSDARLTTKRDGPTEQAVRPPYDYSIFAEDRKHVFVMLSSGDGSTQDKDLRAHYPKSGLYLPGDAPGFMWGVDWYAYQVYASSDARHLVRVGAPPPLYPGGIPDVTRLGLAFYEDGTLLVEYPVRELVEKNWMLQKTGGYYSWIKSLDFDDKGGWLNLVTLDGQEYTFDVRSGLIHRMKKSYK